MIAKVCVLVVVAFSNFGSISACNGYTLKMNSVKNCGGANVIKIAPGFGVTLDNDCNLSFSGCVNVTKPIKTSPGTYELKKPPLPAMEGEVDFCEAISQTDELPTIGKALTAVGVPQKCPIPAKNYCAIPSNKISIAAFKNQLGIAAGTSNGKLTANHDSGKSCIEFSFTLSKARKG